MMQKALREIGAKPHPFRHLVGVNFGEEIFAVFVFVTKHVVVTCNHKPFACFSGSFNWFYNLEKYILNE